MASASSVLRRPPGRRRTPYCNSAAVIAVIAVSPAGSESSQETTPGSGSGRVSSEMTLVSRMITRGTKERDEGAPNARPGRVIRRRSRSLAARVRTWGSFRGSKAFVCRLAFA